MPGPSAEYAWATQGLGVSSCPFEAFRVTSWPNPGITTVSFISPRIVWEGACTSAISPAVFCSTCAKAVCRQHNEFGGRSDIEPHLPSSSFALLDLPGCGGTPTQIMLNSHYNRASVFPISLMVQTSASRFHQVLHHTARRRDMCTVLKSFCQLVGKCCGYAVTHVSRESDVSLLYLQAHILSRHRCFIIALFSTVRSILLQIFQFT